MNIRKSVSVLLAMSVAVACLTGAAGCNSNKRGEETGIKAKPLTETRR
ncbi:MAG: hypothetical protein OSJ68_10160 [Clostridia bacterium]|nr:hypothetical protein [Clostridia bacterium]